MLPWLSLRSARVVWKKKNFEKKVTVVKGKFSLQIIFWRDICVALFFQEIACESARRNKEQSAASSPSLGAAGPRSRFHWVTMKSGEVTAQHLSDCWHFQRRTQAPRLAGCHSWPRCRGTRRPKCHGAFFSTEVRQRGTLSADAPTHTLRHLML